MLTKGEKVSLSKRRHGHCRRGIVSLEYRAWGSMVRRCHNPKQRVYKWYGARGVTVCDEWRGPGGFDLFLAHIGTAPADQQTVDRIDNARGYEPGNVRWASAREQQRNRSNNRVIEIDGERRCLTEWVQVVGISYQCFYSRVKRGYTEPEAICTPKLGKVRVSSLHGEKLAAMDAGLRLLKGGG